MDTTRTQGDLAAATREVSLLKAQADQLRSEIDGLRTELTHVQREFDSSTAIALIEANERLVISALNAETATEAAVSELGDLARLTQRDALTDTPNRAVMLDRLENAIVMATRRSKRLAVLFVDIDHFKSINDSLGHAAGDQALQIVARRLESVVRHSDTVSRHGGDEFLVLLAEIAQPEDAALIVGKMHAALAEPARLADQDLRLSASIGITVFPDDGGSAALLIQRADEAMYRQKRQRER